MYKEYGTMQYKVPKNKRYYYIGQYYLAAFERAANANQLMNGELWSILQSA